MKSNRNKLLAAIHIYKSKLFLSDADYRVVLEKVTGVQSAAALDTLGLQRLVSYFKSYYVLKEESNYYHVPAGISFFKQKRYIVMLWKKCGFTIKGLDKRVKQQFGVFDLLSLNSQKDLQVLAKDLNNRCAKKGLTSRAE